MKVLITGVSGQLGYDAAKVLWERGKDCRGVSSKELDITDRDAVLRALSEYRPDAVLHCAAYTKVDQAEDEANLCMRVNADGTRNVALACRACGAKMVYKMGRYGRFLACPNFPECRNAKPIVTYIDTPCPKCGARLMEKMSTRTKRRFYGCERFPECDFVSWEKPLADKCPKCGSYMIEKRSRKGEVLHLCANESCRYRESVAADTEAETENE